VKPQDAPRPDIRCGVFHSAAEALPELIGGAAQARCHGGLSAFWSPTVWRWLADTCGFAPKEAEQVAAWAIDALVEGLQRDSSGLADLPDKQEKETP
jgi:hypothetical protein